MTDTVELEVGECTEETEIAYSIQMSAQAVQMLSAKIYSDPVRAVVRELLCNAYDSHIEAGDVTRPIEIRYTYGEFSVRDFGTGLDPESVKTLYSTFCKSTKTDKKTGTGFFGIGSKAPFAVVDEFRVTSYFFGVAYTFLCKKDIVTSIPTIKLLRADPTTQLNGLCVSLLPSSDADFKYEIPHVARWFPPGSVSVNGRVVEPAGLRWYTHGFKDSDARAWDNPYVVYKRVQYTVPAVWTHGLPQCTGLLIPDHEVLNMAPSREHLLHDEVTKSTIEKYAALLSEEVAEEAKTRLSEKSLWTQRQLYAHPEMYATLLPGLPVLGSTDICKLLVELNGPVFMQRYPLPEGYSSRWECDKLTAQSHPLVLITNTPMPVDNKLARLQRAGKRATALGRDDVALQLRQNVVLTSNSSSNISDFLDSIGATPEEVNIIPWSTIVELTSSVGSAEFSPRALSQVHAIYTVSRKGRSNNLKISPLTKTETTKFLKKPNHARYMFVPYTLDGSGALVAEVTDDREVSVPTGRVSASAVESFLEIADGKDVLFIHATDFSTVPVENRLHTFLAAATERAKQSVSGFEMPNEVLSTSYSCSKLYEVLDAVDNTHPIIHADVARLLTLWRQTKQVTSTDRRSAGLLVNAVNHLIPDSIPLQKEPTSVSGDSINAFIPLLYRALSSSYYGTGDIGGEPEIIMYLKTKGVIA